MSETFVDTSFVIAVVNQRDQYHSAAVRLAETYDRRPLVTTEAVLLEIGNALAGRFRAEAAEIISHFLSSTEVEVVTVDAALFRRAFGLYRRYTDKSWGLIDCVSFAVMRERDIVDVLTADSDFRQAGFNPLLVLGT